MLNLAKPRYVMPFHGDHKRIRLHGQLAEAVGIDADDIFKGENGLPLEIDERGARFGEEERAGMIFVDGVDIGDSRTSRCATAGCSRPTASSSSSRRSPSRTARSVAAARGDLPRRPVHRRGRRACSTTSATRSRTRSTRAAEERSARSTCSSRAPRRPRRVRLRATAAPADGAAGRRRGLSAGSPRRRRRARLRVRVVHSSGSSAAASASRSRFARPRWPTCSRASGAADRIGTWCAARAAPGRARSIVAAITAFYDVQRAPARTFSSTPTTSSSTSAAARGERQPPRHLAAAQGGRRCRRARGGCGPSTTARSPATSSRTARRARLVRPRDGASALARI